MLSCQRDEFSLPADRHYLNCAYMSPQSRRVEQAGLSGLGRKNSPGEIAADSFFTESDQARALFARLIGTNQSDRIAILAAASYGVAAVARNTDVGTSQNVVVLGEQFPSNYYSWSRLCRENDAELRVVAAPESTENRGARWNEALLAAIDSSTAAVAVPHVHWSDGTRFDLEQVGELARASGAALIVDGTQSVGALELDLDAIRPDALICAGYKYLFGPYGIALGYFGPRYDSGVPLEESWAPRRHSDDFANLVQYNEEYRPRAARYDVGERSSQILLPMTNAALEQVLAWTPAAIQQYCLEITEQPVAQLHELGFLAESAPYRCGHLFGIRPPADLDVQVVSEALEARRISVSIRGSAIRVSPNVYNDAGDLEALLEALRDCLVAA